MLVVLLSCLVKLAAFWSVQVLALTLALALALALALTLTLTLTLVTLSESAPCQSRMHHHPNPSPSPRPRRNKVRARMFYHPRAALDSATLLKLVPPEHRGKPEIVPLRRASDGRLLFSFQRQRYDEP